MRRLIIAIDGPAGAGKSTLARRLAHALGYTYVDSGSMYRVVGMAAREQGIDPANAAALATLVDALDFVLQPDATGQRVLLEGRDVTDELRTPLAGEWASRVGAIPEVRTRLVARQRRLGADGGIVMDGRDIGTVVFPHADCKFFVTASPAERARRRAREIAAPVPISLRFSTTSRHGIGAIPSAPTRPSARPPTPRRSTPRGSPSTRPRSTCSGG